MEPVRKTPPGGEAAVRRGPRTPTTCSHRPHRPGRRRSRRDGRSRRTADGQTGRGRHGHRAAGPGGGRRSAGRRWVGSRTAAGGLSDAYREGRGCLGFAAGAGWAAGHESDEGPLDVGLRPGTPDVGTETMQAHGWSRAAQRAYGWSARVIAAMHRLPTGSRCTSELCLTARGNVQSLLGDQARIRGFGYRQHEVTAPGRAQPVPLTPGGEWPSGGPRVMDCGGFGVAGGCACGCGLCLLSWPRTWLHRLGGGVRPV